VRIEILDEAQEDLIQGFHFYEDREAGLGAYFLDCLFSDIDSLLVYAGIHQVVYSHRRCLSKRFPFAIYYSVEGNGAGHRQVSSRGQVGEAFCEVGDWLLDLVERCLSQSLSKAQ
jgi:hypothetical protein